MATISKPYTFSAGAVIVAAEHNSNFDTIYNDYNGNITNANVASGAAIGDTKLASITTAGKVNISALTVSSQAQGDIIYASGASTWARLGPGTTGQFLKTQGAAANPIWADSTVPAGSVVQSVKTINSAVSTGTTVLPYDDTIPQNTEGIDAVLDRSITPTSATNRLIITVLVNASSSNNAGNFTLALFQDSTANALAATQMTVGANTNAGQSVTLIWEMAAGTTSSTTFKARIGNDQAGTTTINGAGGGRKYGGVCASIMKIQEIKV